MFKLFICAICQVELKPNQGISVHEDSSQPGSLRRWDGPFLCQSCQEKKEAMEGKRGSRGLTLRPVIYAWLVMNGSTSFSYTTLPSLIFCRFIEKQRVKWIVVMCRLNDWSGNYWPTTPRRHWFCSFFFCCGTSLITWNVWEFWSRTREKYWIAIVEVATAE